MENEELNQNQFTEIGQEQNNHDATELLEIIPEEEAELTNEELEEAQNHLKDDVKPTGKKYRISEEDAAKALGSDAGMPEIFTKTKNGVPPQYWLIAINNGAFLLFSLVSVFNIIFLPVLLANLKLLTMFSKKKQINVVSSQPTRKIDKIEPNKSKSTPTKKHFGGAQQSNNTQHIGAANSDSQTASFGGAQESNNNSSIGTNEPNSPTASIGAAPSNRTSFGGAQQSNNTQHIGAANPDSPTASIGGAEESNNNSSIGTNEPNSPTASIGAAPRNRASFGGAEDQEINKGIENNSNRFDVLRQNRIIPSDIELYNTKKHIIGTGKYTKRFATSTPSNNNKSISSTF